MKRKALDKAKALFVRAEQSGQAALASQDFAGFEENWCDFLGHVSRLFTVLSLGAKEKSGHGWYGAELNVQSKEPLLKYLKAARNAYEHGLEEVTARHPSSLLLGNAFAKIGGRSVEIVPSSPGSKVFAILSTWDVALVPVIDLQKQTIDPPEMFFGEPIRRGNADDAIRCALGYLRKLLQRCEAYAME